MSKLASLWTKMTAKSGAAEKPAPAAAAAVEKEDTAGPLEPKGTVHAADEDYLDKDADAVPPEVLKHAKDKAVASDASGADKKQDESDGGAAKAKKKGLRARIREGLQKLAPPCMRKAGKSPDVVVDDGKEPAYPALSQLPHNASSHKVGADKSDDLAGKGGKGSKSVSDLTTVLHVESVPPRASEGMSPTAGRVSKCASATCKVPAGQVEATPNAAAANTKATN